MKHTFCVNDGIIWKSVLYLISNDFVSLCFPIQRIQVKDSLLGKKRQERQDSQFDAFDDVDAFWALKFFLLIIFS